MSDTLEYLDEILESQTLKKDSDEIENLNLRRSEVESLLRDEFGAKPIIKYGGSMVKNTMIRELYDLDIICFWRYDDDSGGKNLEEIYKNVQKVLATKYDAQEKRSAIRIQTLDLNNHIDLHIDVVPGRYSDDKKEDAFLHQTMGDKKHIKTNPQIHINCIKNSGLLDEIRLLKLWKIRNGLQDVKTFVIELLTLKLLENTKINELDQRLIYILEQLIEQKGKLTVQDPANPNGNDLSELLNSGIQHNLASFAENTLNIIESHGWLEVFGSLKDINEEKNINIITNAASSIKKPLKPWLEI